MTRVGLHPEPHSRCGTPTRRRCGGGRASKCCAARSGSVSVCVAKGTTSTIWTCCGAGFSGTAVHELNPTHTHSTPDLSFQEKERGREHLLPPPSLRYSFGKFLIRAFIKDMSEGVLCLFLFLFIIGDHFCSFSFLRVITFPLCWYVDGCFLLFRFVYVDIICVFSYCFS